MASSSTSVLVEMQPEMPSLCQQTMVVEMKTEKGSLSKQKGVTEMETEKPLLSRHTGFVEIKTEMPQLNVPSERLISGNRDKYLNVCLPLYEASLKGNWKTVEERIDKALDIPWCSITENCETLLHVAASAKSTKSTVKFVRKLVSRMKSEDLLLQNRSGNTALCLAAAGGNVSIAKILVNKNRKLLDIPGSQNLLPLHIASLYGKYDMVKYLLKESDTMRNDEIWTDQSRGLVLLQCVEADFYDIALDIVFSSRKLDLTGGVLGVLAKKTNAFNKIASRDYGVAQVITDNEAMKLLRAIWTEILKRPKSEVHDIIRGPPDNDMEMQDDEATTSHNKKKYSSRVLFIATEMGNTEFIVELIRTYPDLIWNLNDSKQSIFHAAVLHRQEGIYNLLYGIGSMKDFVTPLIDVDGNNMLHLAAMSAKNKRLHEISGVALQMQRELLWYKVFQFLQDSNLMRACNEFGGNKRKSHVYIAKELESK